MKIERVLAPNPGPYTGPGTNTYVISSGSVAAVIDPGPVIGAHEQAIVAALGDLYAVAVIVTHNHPDHAPLANPLAERLGAASYGFAPGPDFSPDVMVADGDEIALDGSALVAVHTPGHTWDHLCFLAGDQLFSGDHIMGGSTVIIEDAAAYFESLYRVASLDPAVILPGHGDVIADAAGAVTEYIEHRRQREREIVAAVAGGAHSVAAIAEAVYVGIDPALMPAAARQVEVQLEKLVAENRLSLVPRDTAELRVVVSEQGD